MFSKLSKTSKNIIRATVFVVVLVFLIYLLPKDNRIMVKEGSADISIQQVIDNATSGIASSSSGFLVCSNGVCLPKGVTMADLDQEKMKDNSKNRAKELISPSGFINSQPFKIADLVGKKVILVDFWTYSCVNCQHVIPYLNDWYSKYKDKGLEIVSIHTPEFEFEKNRANVEDAVSRYGIKYPVVMDNQFGTWNAYGNKFWPRIYLIDSKGNIVGDHIGEGNYTETENKIKELLSIN